MKNTLLNMWKVVLKLVFILDAITGYNGANFHKLPNGGEIKAVLIAGSKGYDNYRHQADICHAYQILRGNGIPEENIIVMMYDDIAYNAENPGKGVIINRPGGPNVYKNVKKDYTGKDVNKQVFFDVLLGNKDGVRGVGTGRVLESGPKDHVFVNFVDHGNYGILGLPSESMDLGIVKASEFIEVLEKMAKNSRFAKMFLYINACNSGSMFDNLLPENLKIFAMTSAARYESSYACFCDRNEHCLGSEFSINWMRIAETRNLKLETVHQQFESVRTETNNSHVEEYGDLELGDTKLSEVLGFRANPLPPYPDCYGKIPVPDIPVVRMRQRIQDETNPEERTKLEEKLQAMLQGREEVLKLFSELAEEIMDSVDDDILDPKSAPALTKKNVGCYENVVTHFNEKCIDIIQNPFVGSKLHLLAILCDKAPERQVVETINKICQGKPKLTGVN